MTDIQVDSGQAGTEEMYADVAHVITGGDQEIKPSTAAAVAAMCAHIGGAPVFSRFASGEAVGLQEMSDAITDVRDRCGYHTGQMSNSNRDALDCLATFAIAAALGRLEG